MAERSVLIITPFFAPQSHAAVFRAYKLAKYLPQYGWKPYVVTTDTNYLYNEDQGLLDALSPEVEIHRARYIEPTLRGVRMALGGRDRSFKAIKEMRASHASGVLPSPTKQSYARVTHRVYRYLLDAWLKTPDAYWTWEKPAIRLATDLIKAHQIPLVLTSADPYTTHRIGHKLKQRGVQWIADFRDPHTHSFLMHSQNNRVYGKQRAAERLAVQNADAITVAAESIALILTESYGRGNVHPIHFIPTGLDENLLIKKSDVELPSYPYFLFSGEFLPGYGEEFFRIFSQVMRNPDVAASGLKLLFIGRSDVNSSQLMPLIRKYSLEGCVDLVDHLPQEVLYQYLQNAKAALLIPGRRALWWALYAKLVDYIALQKPVVAIVPNPSEARMHLERSGLGIFLDNEQTAVEQLTHFILADTDVSETNSDYCERFFATAQVSKFAELFEQVVTEK